MSKVYCLYHKECLDGFASAWTVYSYFKRMDPRNYTLFNITSPDDVQYIPITYGEPLPPLEPGASEVYIVDFSFSRDILRDLCASHRSVRVYDHHKTAREDLEDWLDRPSNLHLVFDMGRSGCQITWDELMGQQGERHPIINYVGDRDLWKFEYEETEAVTRMLYSSLFDFKVWDRLGESIQTEQGKRMLLEVGYALLGDDQKKILWHVENTLDMINIGGYDVLVTNTPKYLVSELNNLLLKEAKVPNGFVAAFHNTDKGRVYRLNSLEGSDVDVSVIAKQYGGGGHKHSAGFTVPKGHVLAGG